MEAIAVALLATAVSAPAIMPIKVVVIGIGSLATAGSQVKKKLFRKEGKHKKSQFSHKINIVLSVTVFRKR